MPIYTYEDAFLIDSIAPEELESKENEALQEIEKLNIADDFYKERLVKSRVYMLLALNQLENQEMKDKYTFYEKEFNRYLRLAKANNSLANISNIPVARG